MSLRKPSATVPTHWVAFGLAVALTATMYGLYGANIVAWRNSPDFGWRTMYDSGPNIVAEVFDAGKAAGLRAGDTILAINGRLYGTFEELFFGNLRSPEAGSANTYTVIRDGKRVELSVATGRLGFPTVLRRSGPLFAMGLVYVLIGALVFLMKPRAIESWLFLVMTCFTGMRVSFAAPADLVRPTWFYDLRFLNEALLPASLIHLATRFPQTRAFIRRRAALAIGCTIVKHDHFAIDVIVRRTYGYVLSTGTVVATYAAVVSLLNFTFRGSDVARSPVFSIGFALVVVFLFEPIHKRFQGFVDRVFYRQQYDYRKPIKNISEAMTSILDPDLISKTLIGSVVKEMFLENGTLLLPDTGSRGYQVKMVEGMDARGLPSSELPEDDAVLGVLKEKKDALLRHDVIMNPLYEPNREDLQRTFQSLSSELMLPMTYKDELRGIISLGRKKSGKLFTPEDLDLLKTLTSQSAIALENAQLFKENLQKGRMEEEQIGRAHV